MLKGVIKHRTTEYPAKVLLKSHLLDCVLAKEKAAHPQVRREGRGGVERVVEK